MPATHLYSGIAANCHLKAVANCKTFADYKAWLEATPGTLRGKILASNVRVYYDWHDTIRIQLYHTIVLLLTRDNRFWANNGGYNTPTVRNRLNQFGPPWVTFWHYRKQLHCRFGPCAVGRFYPVPTKPPWAEDEEQTPPRLTMPSPLARRRRTIRLGVSHGG